MGNRSKHAPRRGSLGYRRSRASSSRPIVTYWPGESLDQPQLGGYPTYKAGMLQIIAIEDRPRSHMSGQEIIVPCTVLEAPSIVAFGLRSYKETPYGLKIVGDLLHEELNPVLGKSMIMPKNYDYAAAKKKFEETLEKAEILRMKVYTQPHLTAIGSKKPQIMEIPVYAKDVQAAYEYALPLIHQELLIEDFVDAGQFVDVIGITKGHGFQGPVKRHGVKILPRKTKDARRRVGSLGAWRPSRLSWTVPRMGQMGYERRTAYNKRVMLVGANPDEINVAGGFIRYGPVKSKFLLVHGSVPGPKKRMVILRRPVRKGDYRPVTPNIVHISTISQQGNKHV